MVWYSSAAGDKENENELHRPVQYTPKHTVHKQENYCHHLKKKFCSERGRPQDRVSSKIYQFAKVFGISCIFHHCSNGYNIHYLHQCLPVGCPSIVMLSTRERETVRSLSGRGSRLTTETCRGKYSLVREGLKWSTSSSTSGFRGLILGESGMETPDMKSWNYSQRICTILHTVLRCIQYFTIELVRIIE